MKKNAFVLLETIVVIAVLSVILIILYAGYSKVLIDVKKKALYDNVEYIYKTTVIRDYLENNLFKDQTIDEYMNSKNYITYCSNTSLDTSIESCNSVLGHELFSFMKVNAVYFMKWNTYSIESSELSSLEATTQKYIKNLDPQNLPEVYRIIVMYTDENDSLEPGYQYATLRIGSRG